MYKVCTHEMHYKKNRQNETCITNLALEENQI